CCPPSVPARRSSDLAAAGTALAVQAPGPVNASDKAAIEKIVRDYILANPEIIPEAVEKLQAKRAAGRIEADRPALETPYAGAWRSEEHTSELQSREK